LSRVPGSLLVLVPVIAWSLNFTIAKYALSHGLLPMAYTAPRFVFASIAFCLLTLHREGTLRVARRDLPVLVAAGVVGICFNQLSFVFALRHASASTVALLFGMIPIFVGVLSHVTKIERLGRSQWSAAAISSAGVAMVVLGASSGVSSDGLGIALAIAAPLTWAVYSVGIAPLLQRYSSLRVSAIVCTIGTVPLTLASIGELGREDWGALNFLTWASLVYGAVIAYVLATAIWLVAIKRIGAPRASLYQNLQPFLGAIFALVLLSERLTWLEVVGGVVIGSGILIARRARRPPPVLAEIEVKV
jgi:drug/metabolite transporter (DMT)-like permease